MKRVALGDLRRSTVASSHAFAAKAAVAILCAGLLAGGLGCTGDAPAELAAQPSLHGDGAELSLLGAPARALLEGSEAMRISGPTTFRQVTLMFDADDATGLELRAEIDGTWTTWSPVEVTWSEGRHHVGRVFLPAPARAAELRGARGADFARIDLHPEVVARNDFLARDLPFEQLEGERLGDHFAVQHGYIPGWVVTRAAWGARDPSKVCGSAHSPNVMTIHHTVTPNSDTDIPARMRQIQAYHIDGNGWCDIGYHFVVGLDGRVYQAISSEARTGIHTGGANTNNVGICFMGTYTDVAPSDAMFSAGGDIVRWVSDTYGIPRDRAHVKGHREWNSTACPGDQLYARLSRLIDEANGGGTTPTPTTTYDVALSVRYLGLENMHAEGASASLGDALPGATFQAEVVLKNTSSDVLRDVELGYWFEHPHLRATNFRIYTDYPARDGATWVINDADTAEGQPARDGLGQTGRLIMHAFSVNESKRVVFDLVATDPSIGAADHPDVRVWLQNARDAYHQDAFGAPPTANAIGRTVQAYAEMDVLSRDAWFFDSGAEAGDTEGWRPCPDEARARGFGQDVASGTLTMEVLRTNACLMAPTWTQISADTFDQLAIGLGSDGGPHEVTVYWAGPGEDLHLERSATFEAGGSGFATYVVPLGEVPSWAGTVTTLRVDPQSAELATPPAAGEGVVYSLDFAFFQSSTDDGTSTARRGRAEEAPAVLLRDGAPTPDPGEEPEPDPGEEPEPDPGGETPEVPETPEDPGPETPGEGGTRGPRGGAGDDQSAEGDVQAVNVAGGCSIGPAAGARGGVDSLLALLGLGLFTARGAARARVRSRGGRLRR
jgi:hypothetical protein